MADEGTDEVKLFRVQHEDEGDAPSPADDKKDVALEEEMESKSYGGSAFHTPSTPSPASPFPFNVPGMPSFDPMAVQLAAALTNYHLINQQVVANQLALKTAIYKALSPGGFLNNPMANTIPSNNMYNRLNTMAPPSPLAGVPGMGLMGGVGAMAGTAPLNSPFPPFAPMLYGGYGGVGVNPSTSSAPSTPARRKRAVEKEEHIKKPKNAYFWFMEQNRKVLMNEEEWKDKQSADLNKELGKRWHDMKDVEKKPYFEMAAKDKENHAKRYPNWSARENYANSAKRKKKTRDRTTEPGEGKKCRARFGVDAHEKWCKHCVRKKKCLYTGGREEDEKEERASSHSTHQTATDSESDLDDDPTLSVRDLDDDGVKMVLNPLTPSYLPFASLLNLGSPFPTTGTR